MRGEFVFLGRGLWAMATGRLRRSDHVVSLCPSVLAVLLGRLACRRGGHHVELVHDIQSGLAAGLCMVGGRRLIAAMRLLERRVLTGVDTIFVLSAPIRQYLTRQGVTTPIQALPNWGNPPFNLPITTHHTRQLT